MSSTFLDSLSQEAKETVLRNLSERPDAPHWHHFVDFEDALSSMHSKHPLAETARKTFDRMMSDGYGPGLNVDQQSFERWIQIGGEFMTYLTIPLTKRHYEDAVHKRMYRALKRSCVAVRSLDIAHVRDIYLADKVLRATRGRVRELKACSSHSPSIKRNCVGLEALDVFQEVSGQEGISFLKVVGSSLETLTLRRCIQREEIHVLRSMKTFCPRLTHVSIDVSPGDVATLADVLYSYREQLLLLDTSCFSEEELSLGSSTGMRASELSTEFYGKLVAACPNMKCSNVLRFVQKTWSICALGRSVQKLDMEASQDTDFKRLALEFKPCTGLQHIKLTASGSSAASALRGLLKYEKPVLTYVKIQISGFKYGDEAIAELAKGARTLRIFYFEGEVKNISVFKNIADNAPLLEKVCLRYQFLAHVAPIFKSCRNLHYFAARNSLWNPTEGENERILVRRLRINAARRNSRRQLYIAR